MKSLTCFLVWAALAGAPEILWSAVMGMIDRRLVGTARRTSAPAGLASACPVTAPMSAES